jgi:5,10-methylene-tetrahydrofolate dehydrogenase/methenyl tetrahydrofolate cyclohydrolase
MEILDGKAMSAQVEAELNTRGHNASGGQIPGLEVILWGKTPQPACSRQ